MNIVKFIEENQTIVNTMSLPLSLLAFIVGALTLLYTIKLFKMKKGIDVKCSYSMSSSVYCDDTYVNNFILENRKDKSIVIFHTYLKIGHNYYLELENFEDNPLIIKPFEVYNKNFDPILFYSESLSRIKLDKLLKNSKVKKKVLLYTTEGTYQVKAHIKMTNPISLFFKNNATAIIHPNRLRYEDKAYGKNIKFLVEFFIDNGEKQIISLLENSYKYKFKGFVLTKESLKDKNSLETFFNNLIDTNSLKNISKFNIIDFGKEVNNTLNSYEKDKVIDAEYYSFLNYHIVGKILTIIEDIQLNLTNYFRNDKVVKKIKKIIFCEK